jgi:hypothetical protein
VDQRGRRPPSHLDAEGKRHVAPTWETLVERQIREAMEAGKFDELPYRGRPLPVEDDSRAGEWALAFRILRNARVAPPWIESDKAYRALMERRAALLARAASVSSSVRRRDRAALEALVAEANAVVARLNAEDPTERQHRRPLDLAAELARYDEAARARA